MSSYIALSDTNGYFTPNGTGWDCSQASKAAPISICTTPSIAAGATKSIRHYALEIGEPGVVVLSAEITVGDASPQNNQAQFEFASVAPLVDLTVARTFEQIPNLVDGVISRYQVTITNLGPQPDNKAQISFDFSLPGEFVAISGSYVIPQGEPAHGFPSCTTQSDGSRLCTVPCSPSASGAVCDAIWLERGQSAEYALDLTTAATAGEVPVDVSAFTGSTDLETGNNQLALAIPVQRPYLQQVQRLDDGVGGIESIGSVSGLAISPDGQHLYVGSRADNAITLFSRDIGSGSLTLVQSYPDPEPGFWLRAMEVAADGANLYVATETTSVSPELDANRLVVYARDAGTGQISSQQTILISDLGIAGLDEFLDIAVSRDGTQVYALAFDMILVFQRSSIDGALTFVQKIQDGIELASGLHGLSELAVGKAHDRVYVAAQRDYGIVVFERDPQTGLLGFVERIDKGPIPEGIWRPFAIATSADDANVFALSGRWNFIDYKDELSSRHFESSVRQWRFDYESLGQTQDVVLTPDDRQALISIATQDAANGGAINHHIGVLEHTTACGELTLREAYTNGVGDIDGLWGAQEIIVSPDNAHVYVAASDLVVFAIDSDRDGLANGVDPNTVAPPVTPCTVDSDDDGVTNDRDAFPNDPDENADTDGDGIGNNSDTDDDNDGLTDTEEQQIGTNPTRFDTDGDGLGDGQEVSLGTNPLDQDTDDDSIPDGLEVDEDLNPLAPNDCPAWLCRKMPPAIINIVRDRLSSSQQTQ
jgi:6-phosphogluconolactonase (cycloisomerase 2 family)